MYVQALRVLIERFEDAERRTVPCPHGVITVRGPCAGRQLNGMRLPIDECFRQGAKQLCQTDHAPVVLSFHTDGMRIQVRIEIQHCCAMPDVSISNHG